VRRIAVIAACLLGASLLAACQSQGVSAPVPQTVIGTVTTPTTTFPIVPAFHLKGNASAGKTVFGSAGCNGCHTLAAANATGTVGPNLDSLKPDYQAVTAQVTNGGPGMPAFGTSGQLTTQQIADVAAYVVTSTGGTVP
jgi:mono/diheme cytochrome c family protein